MRGAGARPDVQSPVGQVGAHLPGFTVAVNCGAEDGVAVSVPALGSGVAFRVVRGRANRTAAPLSGELIEGGVDEFSPIVCDDGVRGLPKQ